MTKERPIIFGGSTVRAILDGRKTQTRRVVKLDENPGDWHTFCRCAADGTWIAWGSPKAHGSQKEYDDFTQLAYQEGGGIRCPYGVPGERLWVRETHSILAAGYQDGRGMRVVYRADDEAAPISWSSPIHMPRWASRLTLELVSVRLERLNEISEEDAAAEGCPHGGRGDINRDGEEVLASRIEWFSRLWDSINGANHPWSSNPWVWVVEFRRAAGGGA